MSFNMFTHISKFISLSGKRGSLAALLCAASFGATPALAQQSSGTSARLQDLEQVVADQQAQIQAQQAQMQDLVKKITETSGTSATNVSLSTTTTTAAADAKPERADKGYVVGSDRALVGAWTNDGPYFKTKNGDFTWHPRFTNQMDYVSYPNGLSGAGSNGTGSASSVEFRRLRIGCDGTFYDNIDYIIELDAAGALQNADPSQSNLQTTGLRSGPNVGGGGAGTYNDQGGNVIGTWQPTTNFATFKEVPWLGNIRVGNQQDWLSFEHIQSARFTDFMERASIMDAFNGPSNNGYAPGISTFRNYFDQRVGLQLGVYKTNMYDSGYTYNIGNANWTTGGRLFWTPYYDEATNGRYLVHVGVGGEYRSFDTQALGSPNGTNVRLRSRGELRSSASTLVPNYADTGNFYADGQGCICPEMAVNWGALVLQAEWEVSMMNNAATVSPNSAGYAAIPNAYFTGGYVQACYFLTGENKQYNRSSGVFGRNIPNENAAWVRGRGFAKGAWQVGVRYSYLDLNSGLIQGGQVQDLTWALNWNLTPNCRLMLNYVTSYIDNAAPGTYPGTTLSLNGSKFTGQTQIGSLGTRLDYSF